MSLEPAVIWQGGRYSCRRTDKWFPREAEVPSGSRQNFCMNIKLKRKPPNCKRLVATQKLPPQITEFACDIIDLHKKPQQTEDRSSSYSQVSSHMEAGYNNTAFSWPSEQFLLPFVTEARAPTGLHPVIPVEIWDQMNLFHISLPNPGW